MKITILTLFPEMFEGFLKASIISRIIEKGLAEIEVANIRDFASDRRHVDDTPYGGGAGMLMKVDVVNHAIRQFKAEDSYVLLTSPKAKPFRQSDSKHLLQKEHLIFVCGHYEGIDDRISYYVDENISIGDYILTGGELASMVIVDCLLRQLEEGISRDSLLEESFNDGLLEYPQYTRPYEYEGHTVPEVLTNGNHKLIKEYNDLKALEETYRFRKDLLEDLDLNEKDKEIIEGFYERDKKED